MLWRQIHRWLGLVAGTVALVLGLTGTVLSLDPVLSSWQAQPTPAGLTVAQLAERVKADLASWADVVKSSKIEAE